jgi:hypothetical protein
VKLALAIVIALAGPALADDQPWVAGVTEDQKARAQKLLDEGNALFLEKKYSAALDRYKAATGEWDHPAIRFNIVRCLIQLDKPVEAYDNLTRALKYGAAPLEDAVYAEALSYEKLLANQIAEVQVSCTQAGVKVTLDGRTLADCPASEVRRVTPGAHQVVGEKAGYLTRTTSVVVVGGSREAVTVALDPIASATTIVHRWPTWVPWVVFGSGFGVAAIGGLFELKARGDMESYERAIASNCAGAGCSGDKLSALREQESSAKLENRIAIGLVAAGIATIATGGVLFYLNRGEALDVSPTTGGAIVMLRGRL